MNIGLLGFGTVGKGVYDLLSQRDDCCVKRILYRRALALDGVKISADIADILNDDTIDTVVEAIGGLHPAYEYVRDAIHCGKNIVTANKALIAAYYDELLLLAETKGVKLRCTAAVGGGIGWLNALERARQCQQIQSVSGIMNGTCNYILDSMTRLGLSYEDALSQAQALGYAESDPSADIDGLDTWNKLIISANIAFGISLDAQSIPVAGIRHIMAEDIAQFTSHQLTCKLIGSAVQSENGYCAFVQPVLFPDRQPESVVPANYNHISFVGSETGKQSFYGQGAGRYPTAYNVVQDCVELMNGKGFYCRVGQKALAHNDQKLRYYIRGGDALPCRIEHVWGNGVITEPVRVDEMYRWLQNHPTAFIASLSELSKEI